ncbi:MAG: ABC transporter permease [Bacilli bacterium]|nr:ABC transporter permease [Bacilli bacterium]
MMRKFMFLTTYGLKKKFKSKAFIISNVVLVLLLALIINIDVIINFFGGDFNEKLKIYVVDNSNESFEIFKANYDAVNISLMEEESDYEIIKTDKETNQLQEELEYTNNIIVEFNKDEENYLNAKIISESYMDTLTYQSLSQSINSTKYMIALNESNIDQEELIKISNPVNIERIILDEEKTADEESANTLISSIFPALIMPIFMLVVLLVQFIGSEINEEKSTRSMEVIISNVPAKIHFFTKLVVNNVFVITQALLLIAYGAIGLLIRNIFGSGVTSELTQGFSDIWGILTASGFVDKLIYIIPLTAILMILSFVAYSLIAGILASMTVNAEDFQQIQTPIMIICAVGYYLSFMANMFEGSIFIKILSYVPLISCMLSPSLLVIGQIGIIDVLISIIVMIVFILFASKYGLRIYKTGILNYSTDKIWTRMFNAAKSK